MRGFIYWFGFVVLVAAAIPSLAIVFWLLYAEALDCVLKFLKLNRAFVHFVWEHYRHPSRRQQRETTND